jgi:hypothetical protein
MNGRARSIGHLCLQLQKWKYICERDRQETEEAQRQQAETTSPMCVMREADLRAGMDDMGRYANKEE